jgi:hypothetical protein
MSNRLATIVTRQRTTRTRDALFAACVALATLISLSGLGTAIAAAQ